MLFGGIDMTNESNFFARFLEEVRLTVNLLTGIGTVTDFPDWGLRSHLFGENAPFLETFPPMEGQEGKKKVWLLRDRYRCRYLFSTAEDNKAWLAGPYMTEDMTMRDIARHYEKLGIKNIDFGFLRQYYLSLPKLRDENLMDAVLHTHCVTAYGSEGFELVYWEMVLKEPAVLAPEPVRTEIFRDVLEERYAREQRMMDCIAQGNYSGAAAAFTRLEISGLEARTASRLRDSKNFAIVLNTLCRVAARNGGAHPLEIDQCSRELSLRIENAAGVRELREVREDMLKQYCGLVRSVEDVGYSPIIRQVVDYISAEFANSLTLRDTAAKFGLSTGYLSVLFKRETGKTFTAFVNEKRLAYAKQLLGQTSLPVNEVAAECGIPDNNYFARIFKAQELVTPLQYRASRSFQK